MNNEKNCIICYDEIGIQQLCKKCNYIYCNECSYKMNYNCSICYRYILKKNISETQFIYSYILDNYISDNEDFLNNIDINQQNINIFIYIHYYLNIFNNCMMLLCIFSLCIYFLNKIIF